MRPSKEWTKKWVKRVKWFGTTVIVPPRKLNMDEFLEWNTKVNQLMSKKEREREDREKSESFKNFVPFKI